MTPVTGLTHMMDVMAEKERDVRRYNGESVEQMDVERRLIDLYPGLKERDREREGFIYIHRVRICVNKML